MVSGQVFKHWELLSKTFVEPSQTRASVSLSPTWGWDLCAGTSLRWGRIFHGAAETPTEGATYFDVPEA